MTAAHDYQDMHRLVDRLSPSQVRRLRVLAFTDPELHDLVEPDDAERPNGQLLALAGIWENGPADASEQHDELISARFKRSS